MKTLTLLALCVATLVSTVQAQRPWVHRQARSFGSNAQVITTPAGVIIAADTAYVSSDFGASLTVPNGLPIGVRTVYQYFNTLSIAAVQEQAGAQIKLYLLTPGSLEWQFASDCPVQGRDVTAITSSEMDAYIGTNSNVIYHFANTWDTLRVSDETMSILDLHANGETVLAYTTKGVYVSVDKGKQWTNTSPVGAEVFSITSMDGVFIASTSKGVFRYSPSSSSSPWTPVGIWSEGVESPRIVASATYQGKWYALAQTAGSRQLYAAAAADSSWKVMGYELPGASATVMPRMMTMDLSHIILYHTVANPNDTVNGLYSYDVLDLTDVAENESPNVSGRRTAYGLEIVTPEVGSYTVTVYDIVGTQLYARKTESTGVIGIEFIQRSNAPYAVILTDASGNAHRILVP